MDQTKAEPYTGNVTPDDLADETKHRQGQTFEAEDRRAGEAGDDSGSKSAPGVDPIGHAAGSDTSGAVAHPAEISKPGASRDLGGTPGANSTRSGGRNTGY